MCVYICMHAITHARTHARMQHEAAMYGLQINKSKTCRLAHDSDEEVRYADGSTVPRVHQVVHLGAIIHDRCDPGPEIKARIAKAQETCTLLRPLWGSAGLSREQAVMVIRQCVVSRMTTA